MTQGFKRLFRARRPGFRCAGSRRAWITLSGLLLLGAAWLPSLMAGVLAVADLGGEHEFRCSAMEDGFEVTLHHPDLCEHHHTLLERALIGAAGDRQSDHHLRFALSERFSELSDVDLPPVVADVPPDPRMPLPPQAIPGVPAFDFPSVERWGPPPLWRGVVMTI